MAENQVKIAVELQYDKLTGQIKAVNAELGKIEQGSKSISNVGTSAAKSIGAGFAKMAGQIAVAYVAAKQIVAGLTSSIEASNKQELATTALNAALARTGQYSEVVSKRLQEMSAEFQRATTYSDEMVQQGMALAINLGVPAEKMNDVTKAAIGLSKTLGIDLQTAFKLIGKAAQGHTETLLRYGIVVDKNASKEQQFQQVLQQGISMYANATAEAGTFAGKMAQFHNIVGDLQERIGDFVKVFIANIVDTIMPLITEFISFLDKNKESIISIIDVVASVISGIIKWNVGQVRFISDVIGAFVMFFVNSAANIYNAAKEYIGGVGSILKSVANAFVAVLKGDFARAKEELANIFRTLKDDVIGAVVKGNQEFRKNLAVLWDTMKSSFNENIGGAIDSIVDAAMKHGERVKKAMGSVGFAAGQEMAKGITEGISKSVEAEKAKPTIKRRAVERMLPVSEEMAVVKPEIVMGSEEGLEELVGQVNTAQESVNALTSSFQSFFETLLTNTEAAGNAFTAFFDNILRSFLRLITEILARQAVLLLLNSLTGGAGGGLLKVLGFKEGGVINLAQGGMITRRPTLALLSEYGQPELVIPEANARSWLQKELTNLGIRSTGSIIINQNIRYAVTDVAGAREIARQTLNRAQAQIEALKL